MVEDLYKYGKVFGYFLGFFVFFFIEMWEWFFYYGMWVLFVIFLIGEFIGFNFGWGWECFVVFLLLGIYIMMVYFMFILGGYVVDKIIGYWYVVVIGVLFMILGYVLMVVEMLFFFYIGIVLLIFGNGFFKFNMIFIILKMYEKFFEKKDGVYIIFYMGVNVGVFLGIMLCGYFGEKVSWSFGFGLVGIFMFFGML